MSPALASSNFEAVDLFEGEEFGDLRGDTRPVATDQGHVLARLHRALEHAADGQAPEVVRVVEVRDQHLEDFFGIASRFRHGLDDGVEEGNEVLHLLVRGHAGKARPRVGVNHRELELGLGRVEVDEEVVDRVQDFLDARVLAVDLVDDHDGRELLLEGLAQHVAGLGKGAFRSVDQEQDAVDHAERSLDFAAEVRVARGVDDVDLRALVADGRVLRENGDAAFAFEVVRVHDPLGDFLVLPESAGLAQESVHERGLAMIDVGDDGDIAQLSHGGPLQAWSSLEFPRLEWGGAG